MNFWPSNLAINKRKTVYILILLTVFIGSSAYLKLPREWTPDIQIPILIAVAPYPGASPEEVESILTRKFETELQGLDSLKKITSASREGVSEITLEFDLGFNIREAKDDLQESIDRIMPDLPSEVEHISIVEINLSERPIFDVNISGKFDLEKLKNIAEDLQEKIENINGVLEVKRSGGLEREVVIEVDPKKLEYYGLGLKQVIDTIQNNNRNIPGGALEVGNIDYSVRVPGEISTPEELNNFIVTSLNNQPIYVRDLAKVSFAYKRVTTKSRLNYKESVSLSISKRTGTNMTEIVNEIKEILSLERQKLDEKIDFFIINDQSKEVENSISNLENNIITGFFFVTIVLLLVMGTRNALLVSISIPLSMLLSFLVLDALGITLNMVVLFSLILALGMLVDNAIVIVENIFRHVQSGKPRLEAAKIGIGEIAFPVITSTLTTLAAFLPLLFMPNIIGEFMGYLPKTLIVTLSASLFVGLVFNPALCSQFIKIPKSAKLLSNNEVVERSKILKRYGAFLHVCLRWKYTVIFLVILAWLGIAIFYFSRGHGVEFFPQSQPKIANLNVYLPYGTTVNESDRVVKKLENLTQSIAGDYSTSILANVGSSRGRRGGVFAESHLVIKFPDWENWEKKPNEVIAELRQAIAKEENIIPGIKLKLTKPSGGPPTGKAVNIEIHGEDFLILKDISLEIQNKIKVIKGLVNLEDNFNLSKSDIVVTIDREKTSKYRLTPGQISGLIRTAVHGREASTFRKGEDEYDIIVKISDKLLNDPEDLGELNFVSPDGSIIYLKQIANISTAPAYSTINHVASNRVITVGADAEGVPSTIILQQVKEILANIELPPGYSVRYTGEEEERSDSQAYLTQSFVIAIFLIFLVLVAQFNSFVLPLLILSSVFLSLMGVFLGLTIHQRPFSIIMGGIGTISLAGVVVNNSIVLIDYIRQLRRSGLEYIEAVVLACQTRLRPVMLTAITTILGLLPIALKMDINVFRGISQGKILFAETESYFDGILGGLSSVILFGSDGGTLWLPMSYAMIYGLSVSTLLTLIALPVIYCAGEQSRLFFASKFSKKT